VVVVSDGVVAYANARLVEFFPPVAEIDAVVGQSPEALHEALSEAMADPDAFVAAGLNAIAEGRAVRGRFVETTDGRILEQHFIPIRDGDRMWVYRDVTARLQVERRQAKLLRLERRARRAAEEQNDRLRELDELKTAFVATVSHELRTPLSALTSYIDLLLDPGGDPLSEQQRRIAGSAYRGAERLARLVDDLLVLARLQSRTLEVHAEPVDVGEAVSEAVEEVVRAAGADVEIDADIAQRGPRVVGDHERITQVVANLLGNARKFAAERVEVHARADAAGWTIDVADDGPGVAPDELARVFEPFFRGRDAVAGHRPGTGLGLAISAQLVDLLGGTLTLENRDEGGARARLVLPIGEPS
jgi:signal transduction histidine kinase